MNGVIGRERWEDLQDALEEHNRKSCDRLWNAILDAGVENGRLTPAEADARRPKPLRDPEAENPPITEEFSRAEELRLSALADYYDEESRP